MWLQAALHSFLKQAEEVDSALRQKKSHDQDVVAAFVTFEDREGFHRCLQVGGGEQC
jgi:hypothetical protein